FCIYPGDILNLYSLPTLRSSDLNQHLVPVSTAVLKIQVKTLRITQLKHRRRRKGKHYTITNLRQGGRGTLGNGHDASIGAGTLIDRKSTRLNSSHVKISYAVLGL